MNSTDPVVVSLRDKAIDRYLRGGFKTDDPIVNQLLIGEKGKFSMVLLEMQLRGQE
ncbi:hypothetical protein HGG76_26980 [Ochrobactrum tritici]|uniref:Uncharacterized protein n=1 Tax=Brucella tritici TaxID=94626 RepID=A0A7X6JBP1_9HYPH|nr:hypothetical protein [Brucella tritici]